MSGDDSVRRDEQRRIDNERSRSWAKHDHEPWTDDEDMFLLDEWVHVDAYVRDEEGVSRVLERTIAACRRRAQWLRDRLDIKTCTYHRQAEPEYIGAQDDPDDQWWSPDYYNNK